MIVRYKKLTPFAETPTKAHPTDAGNDLFATSVEIDEYGNVVYGTGIAVEIPEGYVGLLFPRSSNAKKDIVLTNHVGVIDSGYRGEIMLKFRPLKPSANVYKCGEKIGQLIILPYPNIEWEKANELTETERGTGGYGSTGK